MRFCEIPKTRRQLGNFRFLQRRLSGCNSLSYLKFVKRLILENFSPGSLSEEEELMLAIFHYDVWQKSGAELGFVDFRESVKAIKVCRYFLRICPSLLSTSSLTDKAISL